MSLCAQPAAMVVVIFCLSGCNTDHGTPYFEEGPLPLTGPGLELIRYEQARYQGTLGRVERTLWSDGGTPTDPAQFIAPLRQAVPEHIREKLRKTTPRRNPENNRVFDQPDYYAHATVISLQPDVLIVTMRESDDDALDSFGDYIGRCSLARWEKIQQRTELVDCEGPGFCFYAGTLLPYSDEMYLVSPDPQIKDQRLLLGNEPVVIRAGDFSFRLQRSQADVVVTRN